MIGLHFGFKGIVTIDKGRVDGNGNPISKERVSKFNNLILDSGLQRIGQKADWMDWLHLGTGITPPQPLQTTLVNPTYKGKEHPGGSEPYSQAGTVTSDPQNPYTWVKSVFRVVPQGVSKTYTEMGLGWDDNSLFSRTLIKDSSGNPKGITVLGDEYLDVTYECRMYIPVDPVVHTITPSGDDNVPREITVQASNIDTITQIFGWCLATWYSGLPVSLLGSSSSTTFHNRIFDGGRGGLHEDPKGSEVGRRFNYRSMVRVDALTARFSFEMGLPDNVGTIRTIQVSQHGYCFQMEIDPPFVKSNEDKFSFGYQISWGRR